MGHGGGDRYGYARETLNEEYMEKQLSKFWDHSGPTSAEQVTSLRAENEDLRS
jgi:hypothetical protein